MISESLYGLFGKAVCVDSISLLSINIVNQANLLQLSDENRLPPPSGAQPKSHAKSFCTLHTHNTA